MMSAHARCGAMQPRVTVAAEPYLMPNRLAGETSPYLLQHADNPVDWYRGGRGARAARARTSRSCCRSATRRATGAT
jgi:hypothetical protein